MAAYDHGDMHLALRQVFKHESFRSSEQEEACRATIDGKDVFVTLPTGAGKSLIFQLAAVCRNGVAIVIEPMVSLIQNQIVNATAIGLVARTINSQTASSVKTRITEEILQGTACVLLYVTPEMAKQPWFKDYIYALNARKRLALFCVDEAHVISAWADNFRPDYAKLVALRTIAPELSEQTCIVRQNPARLNLYLDVIDASTLTNLEANAAAFTQRILNLEENGSVIVYCRAKAQCEEVVLRFREFGVPCLLYHADRRKEERELTQHSWLRNQTRVMVATVAFGLGIDKDNVRGVIHMNVPSSLSAYVQEVGRAGRDGRRAYCRLYLMGTEARSISAIATDERRKLLNVPAERRLPIAIIEERMQRMRANFNSSLNFAKNKTSCRHLLIAKHLDFDSNHLCMSNCDNCVTSK